MLRRARGRTVDEALHELFLSSDSDVEPSVSSDSDEEGLWTPARARVQNETAPDVSGGASASVDEYVAEHEDIDVANEAQPADVRDNSSSSSTSGTESDDDEQASERSHVHIQEQLAAGDDGSEGNYLFNSIYLFV